MLSLLLSMANVGAYSDVLAVDMVGGLVVGAVAERLGGKLCFLCGTEHYLVLTNQMEFSFMEIVLHFFEL